MARRRWKKPIKMTSWEILPSGSEVMAPTSPKQALSFTHGLQRHRVRCDMSWCDEGWADVHRPTLKGFQSPKFVFSALRWNVNHICCISKRTSKFNTVSYKSKLCGPINHWLNQLRRFLIWVPSWLETQSSVLRSESPKFRQCLLALSIATYWAHCRSMFF